MFRGVAVAERIEDAAALDVHVVVRFTVEFRVPDAEFGALFDADVRPGGVQAREQRLVGQTFEQGAVRTGQYGGATGSRRGCKA